MLEIIKEAWGWHIGTPAELIESNAFGNVIFRTSDGLYWRICPEELSCEPIAENPVEFKALRADPAFQRDWLMEPLVEVAQAALGPVQSDRCYCLKVPAVLGGAYSEENLGTISREQLIGFAGYMAQQIKDLPDGSTVQLISTDSPE